MDDEEECVVIGREAGPALNDGDDELSPRLEPRLAERVEDARDRGAGGEALRRGRLRGPDVRLELGRDCMGVDAGVAADTGAKAKVEPAARGVRCEDDASGTTTDWAGTGEIDVEAAESEKAAPSTGAAGAGGPVWPSPSVWAGLGAVEADAGEGGMGAIAS